MKSFIFFSVCLLSFVASTHEHREHAAHNHGSGNLSIAFDDNKGKIDFKIPSESIFGFEHSAQSEKDKKTMAAGLFQLENKISEMIVFDATLKCQFSKNKIEVVPEDKHSNHSDTVASFLVVCAKSPVGTKIVFNFQKFFPRIKDLDVQVLAGVIQKSSEAKQNGTVIEL